MSSLLREFVRLALESAPSRLSMKEPTFDADSSANRPSHLDDVYYGPEPDEEADLAPHLKWAEETQDEVSDFGPVPPHSDPVHAYPDPARGHLDNVTWQR